MLLLLSFCLCSCSSSEIFPDIGTNLSAPMEMSIDAASNRLYLVNSNNKVLYKNGSFQVLDITAPTAPALLTDGTVTTLNFSGQMYLDTVGKNAYVTNRQSENNQDAQDNILMINIDETSADFLTVQNYADGSNPFGMAYDAVSDELYVASYLSKLGYFPRGAPQNMATIDLSNLDLSTGYVLASPNFSEVAMIGTQAFISCATGGMLVVDVAGQKADYFVNDLNYPSGINTDGTYVYLADTEVIGDIVTPQLYQIDPAAFPVRVGNADVTVKSRNDAGVVVASAAVGNNPQEIAYSTNYFFVTNFNDGTVSVINRPAMTVNTTITVGTEPFGMAVLGDTYLYVSNMATNSISIIDLATLTVVATYQ